MIKATDKAFPDDKNHSGMTILTYMATQIAAGIRCGYYLGEPTLGSNLESEEVARIAVRDSQALIEEINKHQ